MRAVAAKSSSLENAAKSQGKSARNQTQPVAPANVPVIPIGIPFIQRKSLCPCDGGCPRCTGIIQPKLTVGAPDDEYEQEADRVADQVMRMPDPVVQRSSGCSSCGDLDEDQIQTKPMGDQITPLVQRQEDAGIEEEPEENEEEPVQPKGISNKSPLVTSGLGHRIQSLKGGGQPLSASTRAFFESRFDRDFSNVRVHNDAEAGETARSLNAKAFTTGKDVVFGAGRYSPGTAEGKKLLAHELTHVVQQQGDGRIQRVGNPITEADLPSPTQSGITTDEQELRRFMREVYRRQVLLWTALGTPYVHEIPSAELFTMPSSYAIPNRTVKVLQPIRHPVTNMIDDARAEMNRQNGVGGLAEGVTGVAIRSGYRSAESQFGIWTRWAPEYYNRTQAHRQDTSEFPQGEHSDDAAQYLAEYTNERVFSPGYSPHQMGTAVDVSYEKDGDWAEADSTPTAISEWERSWLYDWLSQNAFRYGFFQNPNINEPWHWEFNAGAAIMLMLIEALVSVMTRNIIIGQLYLGRDRTGEDNEPPQPEQGEE